MTIEKLLVADKGALFRKVDLHVHTPGSADIDPKWERATAADVVSQALMNGLDLIAITDHNSADWCDQVREAAAGTILAVLPGVEISTSEGHLLAIFDCDKPASEIRELLIQAGIRQRDFGNLNALSTLNITDLAAKVTAEGGVAVAAHVDQAKGFWNVTDGSRTRRQQIHACPDIQGFEIVDPSVRERHPSGGVEGYPRSVSCIQGSDSWPSGANRHQLDGIGHRFCYLAMSEMTLSGLRQALLDPAVRIRLMTEPPHRPEYSIEGVWTAGGFLRNEVFRFSDSATCLIGGTGSGKSLTLELIRFALDQQVDGSILPAIFVGVRELLSFALDDADTVSVAVRKHDDVYVVERTWFGDEPSDPRVSRLVAGELVELDEPVDVPTFFPIKGFSQSEIVEYAREQLARLSLIDALINTHEEREIIQQTKSQLRTNATNLLGLRDRLERAETSLASLPGLREEIARLTSLLDDPRIQRQDAWYKERAILDQAREMMGEVMEAARTRFPLFGGRFIGDDDLPPDPPNPDTATQLVELESEMRNSLATSKAELLSQLTELNERLGSLRGTWDTRFTQAEREYQRILGEIDRDRVGIPALHTKLQTLRKRERRLVSQEREVNEEIKPQMARLNEHRDQLLDTLQGARTEIGARRRQKTVQLMAILHEQVQMNVREGADSRRFKQELMDMRRGSRVHEADITQIAEAAHPVPLVKSMLCGEYDQPARECRVEATVFSRLVDNLAQSGRLDEIYELQLVDLDDVVDIRLEIEPGTYRDIERLAHGQKCAVVLMLALAEGAFPLVVDQPEDALHAPWIEEYIVSCIRGLQRERRQVIFATRSANVLVSADAAQVIAMQADATRGRIERTGSIDSFDTRDLIVYHAEGGREAFVRRRAKYGL